MVIEHCEANIEVITFKNYVLKVCFLEFKVGLHLTVVDISLQRVISVISKAICLKMLYRRFAGKMIRSQ